MRHERDRTVLYMPRFAYKRNPEATAVNVCAIISRLVFINKGGVVARASRGKVVRSVRVRVALEESNVK